MMAHSLSLLVLRDFVREILFVKRWVLTPSGWHFSDFFFGAHSPLLKWFVKGWVFTPSEWHTFEKELVLTPSGWHLYKLSCGANSPFLNVSVNNMHPLFLQM